MSPRSGIPFGDQTAPCRRGRKGISPLSLPMTGTPEAMASMSIRPNCSRQAASRQARRAQNVHRVERSRNLAVRNPRHDLNAVGERCCKRYGDPLRADRRRPGVHAMKRWTQPTQRSGSPSPFSGTKRPYVPDHSRLIGPSETCV